jgi:hypothetical protein
LLLINTCSTKDYEVQEKTKRGDDGVSPKTTLSRYVALLAQILDLDNFDEQTVLDEVRTLVAELDGFIEQRTETSHDDDDDEEEAMQDEAGARRALKVLAEELNLSERQVDLIAASADPTLAAQREIDHAGTKVQRRNLLVQQAP